jgi:hypothetical protein
MIKPEEQIPGFTSMKSAPFLLSAAFLMFRSMISYIGSERALGLLNTASSLALIVAESIGLHTFGTETILACFRTSWSFALSVPGPPLRTLFSFGHSDYNPGRSIRSKQR